MHKNFFFLVGLFGSIINVQAQTINLEFPYFAGKTYEFKIVQGEKHLVLANDTIPKGGKVQLTIPEKYKGYKGMSMWYLTNSSTGGGLEMVINQEDFSVSCLDSIPTNGSIVYKNTKENIFANDIYQEQQTIFAKHDVMLYAKRAYAKDHELYPVFDKEYNQILTQYSEFVTRLKTTNLYAARFREIANLTMGIGDIITQDEQLKAININKIITNELDFNDVYTSNHWSVIVNSFVQLHTMVIKNDEQLIEDTKTILRRISNNQVFTDFIVNLTKELTKVGKDNCIIALTHEINKSKKLLNYDGVLSVFKQDISGKAPKLEVIEQIEDKKGSINKTRIIDLSQQKSKYILLVFYQSGCGYCEETLKKLENNYKILTDNGIKIISLSADTDEQLFKTTSNQFPWIDKFCDLQGMNSINFKNYGVIGTPTMYLIDKKGVILDKLSSIESLMKIIGLK